MDNAQGQNVGIRLGWAILSKLLDTEKKLGNLDIHLFSDIVNCFIDY